MRKGILSLLLFALFTPSLLSAESILGCDFDTDGLSDTVETSGCKANEVGQVFCKRVC